MNPSTCFRLSVLPALLLCAAPGCIGRVLTWTPTPPAMPQEGNIFLSSIKDARDPGHGGKDPQVVGNLRGSFGEPSPILTGRPDALRDTLARYLKDTARSAGLGFCPRPTEASAFAAIRIRDFFCDGQSPYTATMSLEVALLDPQTRRVRTSQMFRGESQGQGPMADCLLVLQRMMRESYPDLVAFWRRPELYLAAIHSDAPSASDPLGPASFSESLRSER